MASVITETTKTGRKRYRVAFRANTESGERFAYLASARKTPAKSPRKFKPSSRLDSPEPR